MMMKSPRRAIVALFAAALLVLLATAVALSASATATTAAVPPQNATLFLTITDVLPPSWTPSTITPTSPSPPNDFNLTIRTWKGTVASMTLPNVDGFSFTPSDFTPDRIQPGYHSLGDVTLRVREASSSPSSPWSTYSTVDAYKNNAVVQLAPDAPNVLYAADVTPLLNPGSNLAITRTYLQTPLLIGFDMVHNVTNTGKVALELGAFGVAMIFNNDWTNLDLDTTARLCSFTEPYIGRQGGWVKVTRITGTDQVLVVAPSTTEAINSFEGWRRIAEDPVPNGYTFEGFYEYMFLTKAWRENEWVKVPDNNLWNTPTSLVLQPGQSVQFSLRFSLAPDVRSVDSLLHNQFSRPAVRAVPGYVVTDDMTNALIGVGAVDSFTLLDFVVEPPLFSIPADVAKSTRHASPRRASSFKDGGLPPGFDMYYLQFGTGQYGRARVTAVFNDTTNNRIYNQTVNYWVLPPLAKHVAALGEFNKANQWFADETDPFGRSQSFMPWDFLANTMTLQDYRSYPVGLSDESGAGPGLAVAMKQQFLLNEDEAHLVDLYINNTLFGVKQNKYVPFPTSVQNADYSVRASMFWYPGMPGYNYTYNSGWDQSRANTTWRSYNYVHPTAIYHAMYRVARNNDQVKLLHPWNWYLLQAYKTYMAMMNFAPGYAALGLMVASVYVQLLRDLLEEGYTDEYAQMNKLQYSRAQGWLAQPFPFGSEFPWDSTGQEEIFTSAQLYGMSSLSNSTLAAVLAYTHSIPSWGYHGSARRFWDFGINGNPQQCIGIERNLHHYGSSLNAVVLLNAFEVQPDDYYSLETGIGSITGVLTNIQMSGATSMGYHADPSLLQHDSWDADYGMAFYGHSTLSTCYMYEHPMLAFQPYLCDLATDGFYATVTPRDAFARRVYVEPLGTALELDAGQFETVTWDSTKNTLTVNFTAVSSSSSSTFSAFRLRAVRRAPCSARPGCDLALTTPKSAPIVRNAYVFALNVTSVVFSWKSSSSEHAAHAAGVDVVVA